MSNYSTNPPNFDSLSVIGQRLTEIETERSQLLLLKEQVRKNFYLNKQQLLNKYFCRKKVQLFQNLFKGRVDVFATRWQNDIRAMATACKNYHIRHAIEISRSGNDAHLWICFLEAIPAKDA